jgi:hypothetical protein
VQGDLLLYESQSDAQLDSMTVLQAVLASDSEPARAVQVRPGSPLLHLQVCQLFMRHAEDDEQAWDGGSSDQLNWLAWRVLHCLAACCACGSASLLHHAEDDKVAWGRGGSSSDHLN